MNCIVVAVSQGDGNFETKAGRDGDRADQGGVDGEQLEIRGFVESGHDGHREQQHDTSANRAQNQLGYVADNAAGSEALED